MKKKKKKKYWATVWNLENVVKERKLIKTQKRKYFFFKIYL